MIVQITDIGRNLKKIKFPLVRNYGNQIQDGRYQKNGKTVAMISQKRKDVCFSASLWQIFDPYTVQWHSGFSFLLARSFPDSSNINMGIFQRKESNKDV